MSAFPRRSNALAHLASAALIGLGLPALAASVATEGCPQFHCAAEATGVMNQPIVQVPKRMTKNGALGQMKAQGCSGDGQRLACLVVSDAVLDAPGKGTLKVLNGRTLQPVWGSADSADSYELDGPTAGGGQVPVVFASGRIAAGDATVHALYESDGKLVATAVLSGFGNNMGLTPMANGAGVVSQADGALTVIDLESWAVLGSARLRDPVTKTPLVLVSPSAGSGNTLYAVGRSARTGQGYLMVVDIGANGSLQLRSSFPFVGKTGASPVVVTPAQSGLGGNLVLLHVPALPDDTQPTARLLGLLDAGEAALTTVWSIPMTSELKVAPTTDDASQTLFYSYGPDARVYQASYLTGEAIQSFNIRARTGLGSGFELNGHMVASQSPDGFTLLLSGSVAGTASNAGQYVMAFKPATSTFVWSGRTHAVADAYTGAWTTVRSSVDGVACPVVVGITNGLTRICDF